jgi:PAS domain S-box-containing protein
LDKTNRDETVSLLSISNRPKRALWILVSVALVGVLASWYFAFRTPPIPQRTLRIGFEQSPPVQIRTDGGFTGLAVEIVNEAAKRSGLSLQWVETGTSSDEAFQRGLVDLWPLMADLPDRRKRIHFTQPWLQTNHTLVLRSSTPVPDRNFEGRIALFRMPLHVRLARLEFPKAQLVEFPDSLSIVKEVCRGTMSAAFMEDRAALRALLEKPVECASVELRLDGLRNLTVPVGTASTFEAAGAADKLRREIGELFRDGTMADTVAKYSYYGLDDTWTTYGLMQSAERARWFAWGIGALGIVLIVTVGQATFLRQRKRSEAAIRASEERFRRVFEEGPLGLGLVGKTYRFEKVNGALCQMTGFSEAELLQQSFVNITHPDDVEADVELARRLFSGEIPFYKLRKRYVKKSGEILWIDLTASVIHNPEGEPIHGLAMVEDINEIKRAEDIEKQMALDLMTSRDEVRALAASLMKAQEDERRRISRELHDQICHQLAFLARDISELAVGPLPSPDMRAQLEALRTRAVETSKETHDIAYQMHTTVLDDLGLVISLKDLCSQFTESSPNISWFFEGNNLPASIPPEVATCLYRVAQESLQNAANHSGAENVSVRLASREGAVLLTVQDDGVGMDLKAVKGKGRLGLISMEERALSVNGKLTITSSRGHGTQIVLEAPLPDSNS